jgi:aspartyl-tRNA(Asn)/glutamyl-tRNA(Gln) amidotransferase subunit A
MLNAIAGVDPRDRLSWSSGVDYTRGLNDGIAGLRVAFSPTLGYANVDDDVLQAVNEGVKALESLGAEVVEVDPGLPDPADILDKLWAGAMAGYFLGRLDQVGELIDQGLLATVQRTGDLTAGELANAQQRRNAYYTGMREFMRDFDLLVTPSMPATAFTAGLDEPDNWQRKTIAPLDWTPFSFPFNITGQPAATLPAGFDRHGLPIGMQLVGRWRDDLTVLRASRAFERAQPWASQRPPID